MGHGEDTEGGDGRNMFMAPCRMDGINYQSHTQHIHLTHRDSPFEKDALRMQVEIDILTTQKPLHSYHSELGTKHRVNKHMMWP